MGHENELYYYYASQNNAIPNVHSKSIIVSAVTRFFLLFLDQFALGFCSQWFLFTIVFCKITIDGKMQFVQGMFSRDINKCESVLVHFGP